MERLQGPWRASWMPEGALIQVPSRLPPASCVFHCGPWDPAFPLAPYGLLGWTLDQKGAEVYPPGVTVGGRPPCPAAPAASECFVRRLSFPSSTNNPEFPARTGTSLKDRDLHIYPSTPCIHPIRPIVRRNPHHLIAQ